MEKLRIETYALMEYCEEQKFIDFSDEENDGVKSLNVVLKEVNEVIDKASI